MTPPLVTARAVILHPELDAVLTFGGELPQVNHAGSLYLGSAVPSLFRPLAGGPLTLLRGLAYRRVGSAGSEPVRVDAVFALVAHSAELPRGGAWTRPEKLTGERQNHARVALAPDPRIPWWHRGWFKEAFAWADEVLLSQGVERTSEPVLLSLVVLFGGRQKRNRSRGCKARPRRLEPGWSFMVLQVMEAR